MADTYCRAVNVEGPEALLLICTREKGHDGPHRCRIPRGGGPATREWVS